MSLYLDTKEKTDTLFLTSAAACAAAKAIDELTGGNSQIKWVNDIYFNSKKVCGILCEGVIEKGKIESVVLGVGVNLCKAYDFDADLKNKAGFVFENGDFEQLRDSFIDIFLEEFFDLFDNSQKKKIYEIYNRKNYLSGKQVSFYVNQEERFATVTEIDESIGLCVTEKDTEKPLILTFGEVNIKI